MKLTLFILLIILPVISPAHDSRPLVVELIERADDHFELSWRAPGTVELPVITLVPECQALSLTISGGRTGVQVVRCESGANPVQLEIKYKRGNPSLSTIVRYAPQGRPDNFVTARPGETVITLPEQPSAGDTLSYYFLLGAEHIAAGYDHLLFVLCLVWLAGTGRGVLFAITGFTLGHSLTLALSALEGIQVPVLLVECLIALSIVFLAGELVRSRRDTLTWRFPVVISSLFGLLHGLGFAAVLGEIGLPVNQQFLALLMFNLGVEVGQVVFVGLVMLTVYVLHKLVSRWEQWVHPALPGYTVGIFASLWFWQRLLIEG